MKEFKAGEYAITEKEDEDFYFHPEVGFVFRIRDIIEDHLFFPASCCVKASRCRHATPSEIEAMKGKTEGNKAERVFNELRDSLRGQRPTILERAQDIIHGDREKDYGTVTDNFNRIASLWTTYLNGRSTIQGGDIGMMLALLKIAREANGHKEDNLVDLAGYAGCAEKYNKGL